MSMRLAGSVVYDMDEARAALAGYAFAVKLVAPKHGLGTFAPEPTPLWGYRTFDCVLASPSRHFEPVDVLVAAGLNARLDVAAVAALLLATRRAATHVTAAAEFGTAFADLTQRELANEPPPGTAGWSMNRAWLQMTATPDVDTTRAHKVLHHKKPSLFPILDRQTSPALHVAGASANRNLWQQIHVDLNDSRAEFEDLRFWFGQEAQHREGAPLDLPRMHDILLWLEVTEQRETATTAGERSLSIPTDPDSVAT